MSFGDEAETQEQEFIELNCPFCSFGIDFLSGLAGTAQGCPNCGQSVVVPRHRGEPAGKIPLPLEGVQLTLRRLVLDDWTALKAYWEGADDEQISNWLKQQATHSLTSGGQMVYLGIERKEDSSLLGNFTLQFVDPSHFQAMFQIQVNEGLMTDDLFREACSALFVLCFGGLNLHRIFTQISAENTHLDQRLLATGMRKEAEFRKDRFEGGEWRDTLMFAFLHEDYTRRVGSPT